MRSGLVVDRLRLLELLRREFPLSPDLIGAINGFLERTMLAEANIAAERLVRAGELETWLEAVRPTTYFRFEFDKREEAAAFVAAVSRRHADRWAVVQRRRAASAGISDEGAHVTIVLDDAGWRLAAREFSPLPIVSRIPALALPADARVVLDAATVEAPGSDEVAARLERALTFATDPRTT